MRTFAIGDIHGCLRAFDTLLREIELRETDTLVTLGDYIDRGPDSRGVIDRLMQLSQYCNLVTLRGNHEEILQEATFRPGVYRSWLTFGGEETLASYGSPVELDLAAIPMAHWRFLNRSLVDWYETDTEIFVHGGVDPNLPMQEQDTHELRWLRFDEPQPHFSGKTVICGHTAQENGKPVNLDHAICIDTWVYGDGWLTCLDVNGGRVWQANQKGKKRMADIEDFVPKKKKPKKPKKQSSNIRKARKEKRAPQPRESISMPHGNPESA